MSNDVARVGVDARLGAMVRSRPGLTYTGIVDSGLVDIIQRPESYSVRLTSTKAGEGNDTLLEATTRLIQPIEAHFLFPSRNMVKRTTSYVIAHDLNFYVYTRDPILCLLSPVYFQFWAVRFRKFLFYSWYAAGYLSTHPGDFGTPTQFCFTSDLGLVR